MIRFIETLKESVILIILTETCINCNFNLSIKFYLWKPKKPQNIFVKAGRIENVVFYNSSKKKRKKRKKNVVSTR